MIDLNNIKFTDKEIKEINDLDFIYRNTDLEKFAKTYESEILNNNLVLIPYMFISPDISSFRDIIRVSVNKTIRKDKTNNRLESIEDLKYPPANVAKNLYYNRASYKEQSIFYGGFGEYQALFENPPKKGELFTISTWQLKSTAKLCYVSIFHDEKVQECSDLFRKDWNHYIDQIEKLDKRNHDEIEKLFSLITFFFIRPVNPTKKIEYIFSANIANKIFEMPYPYKIEAIFYPSVPMKYIACNLAILPEIFDQKFEFVKAEEYIATDEHFSHLVAKTINHDDSKLFWENSYIDNELKKFMIQNGVDIKNL